PPKPRPERAVTNVCDQLREAVFPPRNTVYPVAKDAGIRHEVLARLIRKERDIRAETLAKNAPVLGLELRKKREGAMANGLFKITVIQYWLHDAWIDAEGRPCDKGTPGARFVRSRKVPAGTPGAKKVKKKSGKWYGRVPGSTKPVPLSANKVAAQQMLGELV